MKILHLTVSFHLDRVGGIKAIIRLILLRGVGELIYMYNRENEKYGFLKQIMLKKSNPFNL